jgi:hypothetical protein
VRFIVQFYYAILMVGGILGFIFSDEETAYWLAKEIGGHVVGEGGTMHEARAAARWAT